jgi:hypothetical protein
MNGEDGLEMNKDIYLFYNGEKIGVVNHKFLYDDESSSGREICEGCLLVLHDFKYRVKKVSNTKEGYIAELTLS